MTEIRVLTENGFENAKVLSTQRGKSGGFLVWVELADGSVTSIYKSKI